MSTDLNHEHESLHDGDIIEINRREYKIVEYMIQPLGRYSEVYKATRSGNFYAIKVMIPEGSLVGDNYCKDVKERREAFETENYLLCQLKRYSTVVRILDYGVVSHLNLPVIVEEYCNADADKRILNLNRQFSEKEAYCFSVQLFSMLAFSHSKKIAYRDFQQPHFFFDWNEKTYDGVLKVVDWNISSHGNYEHLKIEKEIEGMKKNNLPVFYKPNSNVSKIIFKDKHNSAEEILMDLLKYGAQEKFKCPSAMPLKYRIYALCFKISNRRR